MKPILVYLDSQDFINFSKQPMSSAHAKIFDSLIDLKSHGLATFGVSLFHIAEVLNPDSEGFEAYQKHTGQIIHELTDGQAFPFFSEIIGGEASFPNNGLWFPDLGVEGLASFWEEDYIKNLINEKLREKTDFTRAQRKFISHPKRLSKFINETEFEMPDIFQQMGFNKKDVVSSIIHPARKRREIRERIFTLLSDPRLYCELIAAVNPGENPVRALVEEQFANAKASLMKYVQANEEFNSSIRSLETTIEEIEKVEIETLGKKTAVTIDARKRLNDLRKSIALPDFQYEEKFPEERFSYLKSYFEGIRRTNGKPKESEVVDLLHLLYHKDVDLIRVDRRMAEVLKTDIVLKGKLVPRLSELPNFIEDALSQ